MENGWWEEMDPASRRQQDTLWLEESVPGTGTPLPGGSRSLSS